MRILWYSLSPCGSIRRSGDTNTKHGWMVSLEDTLKTTPGIELHVAFFSTSESAAFRFDEVTYHPMFLNNKGNKLRKLFAAHNLTLQDDKKRMLVRQVLLDTNPDIIHVHGTEEAFGYVLDYAGKTPVVFSIQGLIGPITEKFCAGIPLFETKRLESFKTWFMTGGISTAFEQFKMRATRESMFLTKAKYIFGRTEWDRNITRLYNPGRKYFVVNELLREQISNYKWKGHIADASKDTVKILSIVSTGYYKGLETVLQTANLLKQYCNFKFEWNIAGNAASDEWVKITEKYTGIRSYTVGVNYLGWQDVDQIGKLLSMSDFFIQVSHIENSPNGLCEAMLVGTPCIASNVGGTSTMLRDHIDGVLVPDGDAYAYAGTIVHLLSQPETSERYSICAHKAAKGRHDVSKVLNELMDGYKQILAEK